MAEPNTKRVNLALQGGGAMGAFTWGVLDALLEDGRIAFDGISGTSAGAMNAVVLAAGWVDGGREGARTSLERFWRSVSRQGRMTNLQRGAVDRLLGGWWGGGTAWGAWTEAFTRMFSPYDLNPLNVNPLRDLLEEHVDFAAVRACRDIRLFISATNVRTGKGRVFRAEEINPDVVMASACLPLLFQAVEIDGVPYWDGGYSGNPALYPFFSHTTSDDIVLVQINPIRRETTPRTSREIIDRMNEITFNASLLREMRAIEFVGRLIDEGALSSERYRKIRLHRIDGDEPLAAFPASTKMLTDWRTLTKLKDIGREAGMRWLAAHFDALGRRGTVDMRSEIA